MIENIHTLLVSCQDERGLINKITHQIFTHGLNIILMREFVEEETNTFFMRCEMSGQLDKSVLFNSLKSVLEKPLHLVINPKSKKDIVIYVTKEHHCLSDLLIRNHYGELNANIRCVIGNYADLGDLAERFSIPFVHITHENKSRTAFEDELLKKTLEFNPDYVVLAKFMRILSPYFVERFENKIINIHHSFLPAFIGANPYRQAYQRGVKLIGATSHFVNNNLDEGPIITQEVMPVDHNFTVKRLVKAGHEIEKQVLAKACHLIFEDRVFVSGNKTVVFG
ncbi:MAG: formyltetrahydrofolate deformylase [Cytophagales bacterium]